MLDSAVSVAEARRPVGQQRDPMTIDDDSCPYPSKSGDLLYGFRVNPAGCEGVFKALEDVGWDLAAPHASQFASFELAFDVFGAKGSGGPELQVAEALTAVWNRVLARNMAETELGIQQKVSSGREALAAIAEGDCLMAAHASWRMNRDPDVRVLDGK